MDNLLQHPQQDRPNQVPDQDGTAGEKGAITRLTEKFLPTIRVSLLISLALNFVMLVIGAYGLHKCPVNEKIPLFLLVTGCVGLLAKFISYIRAWLLKYFQTKYLESFLHIFESTVLFLGVYWVFKVYKPSYNSNDDQYCDKTVYMFALVYVMIYLALMIAVLAGFLCFLMCMIFVKKTEPSNERDAEAVRQVVVNSNGGVNT